MVTYIWNVLSVWKHCLRLHCLQHVFSTHILALCSIYCMGLYICTFSNYFFLFSLLTVRYYRGCGKGFLWQWGYNGHFKPVRRGWAHWKEGTCGFPHGTAGKGEQTKGPNKTERQQWGNTGWERGVYVPTDRKRLQSIRDSHVFQ